MPVLGKIAATLILLVIVSTPIFGVLAATRGGIWSRVFSVIGLAYVGTAGAFVVAGVVALIAMIWGL